MSCCYKFTKFNIMKKAFLVLAAAGLTLASCSREDGPDDTPFSSEILTDKQAETLVTRENTDFMAGTTSAIDVRTVNATVGTTGTISITGSLIDLLSGAKINRTVNGTTTTTVIDYGAGISALGVKKSGKITVVANGDLSSGNYSSNITYEAYGVDGNILSGNASFVASMNNGAPFIATSRNTTLNLADGSGQVKTTADYKLAMTSGFDTKINILDDVWTQTGTANYSGPGGDYSVNSVGGLNFNVFSGNIVSGTKQFVVNGKTYTLEYGNGTNDNKVIFTKPDGTVLNLTLQISKK